MKKIITSIALALALVGIASPSGAAGTITVSTHIGHSDGIDDGDTITVAGFDRYLIKRFPFKHGGYRLRMMRMTPDNSADRPALAEAVRRVTHDTGLVALDCDSGVYSIAQLWVVSDIDTITSWETYRFNRWAKRYAQRHECSVLR